MSEKRFDFAPPRIELIEWGARCDLEARDFRFPTDRRASHDRPSAVAVRSTMTLRPAFTSGQIFAS